MSYKFIYPSCSWYRAIPIQLVHKVRMGRCEGDWHAIPPGCGRFGVATPACITVYFRFCKPATQCMASTRHRRYYRDYCGDFLTATTSCQRTSILVDRF